MKSHPLPQKPGLYQESLVDFARQNPALSNQGEVHHVSSIPKKRPTFGSLLYLSCERINSNVDTRMDNIIFKGSPNYRTYKFTGPDPELSLLCPLENAGMIIWANRSMSEPMDHHGCQLDLMIFVTN